jgi:hypothetical protein
MKSRGYDFMILPYGTCTAIGDTELTMEMERPPPLVTKC